MKETYKSDIKGLLLFLGFIVIIVIYNSDYLFSTDTINQIKIADSNITNKSIDFIQ